MWLKSRDASGDMFGERCEVAQLSTLAMSRKTQGQKTRVQALVTASPKRRRHDGALHENLGLRVGTSPASRPLQDPSADPEAGRVNTENEPEGSCPRVDISPVNMEVDNENSPEMRDSLASGDPGDGADTSDLSDNPDLVDALQEARRRVVQLEERQKRNSKKTLYSRDRRPPPASECQPRDSKSYPDEFILRISAAPQAKLFDSRR